MIHSIKCLKQYFDDVWNEIKKFEIRLNDRNYKINDLVFLKEIDNNGNYTNRKIEMRLIYIFDNELYLKENYIIFCFEILKRFIK